MTELPDKLRQYRKEHGDISQATLAFSIGVSTSTISRWERGGDVLKDAEADWIRSNLGIDPPRPSRSAAAKIDLADRVAKLEESDRARREELQDLLQQVQHSATLEHVKALQDRLQVLAEDRDRRLGLLPDE